MADHDWALESTANKSGNRLEAIEAVEIAARHGIKTQYELKKMEDLTTVSTGTSNPDNPVQQTANNHRSSRIWKTERLTVA